MPSGRFIFFAGGKPEVALTAQAIYQRLKDQQQPVGLATVLSILAIAPGKRIGSGQSTAERRVDVCTRPRMIAIT